MGHVPTAKYSEWHDDYMNGDISKEQFLEYYRNEENYRVEDWLRNRSHDDE
ncbi:GH-E family nuclease [Gordonia sp. ABSL1-1]|uniref:GH-E family nuclease n=1 Tax=Gordonia sp. ABSL1-1 TaxID=3053923 RepID=UPI0033658964